MRAFIATVALLGAASLAAVASAGPTREPTLGTSYGGIGATVSSFDEVHPQRSGKPPAGTTYYQVDATQSGRVSGYHVVVGWTSKRSASELLARLTGRELPSDAQLVKPYNGYCAVYRSRWLGRVVFGLPQSFGTQRVFRTGYIIVYAPRRRSWNGANASLVPLCRG